MPFRVLRVPSVTTYLVSGEIILTLSQGGSGGKWQTPHQATKIASRGSGKIEIGDMGIWATCARRMEGRATEELKTMFEEVSCLMP